MRHFCGNAISVYATRCSTAACARSRPVLRWHSTRNDDHFVDFTVNCGGQHCSFPATFSARHDSRTGAFSISPSPPVQHTPVKQTCQVNRLNMPGNAALLKRSRGLDRLPAGFRQLFISSMIAHNGSVESDGVRYHRSLRLGVVYYITLTTFDLRSKAHPRHSAPRRTFSGEYSWKLTGTFNVVCAFSPDSPPVSSHIAGRRVCRNLNAFNVVCRNVQTITCGSIPFFHDRLFASCQIAGPARRLLASFADDRYCSPSRSTVINVVNWLVLVLADLSFASAIST